MIPAMSAMTGVVLAGGRSSRFGADKFPVFRDRTLAVLRQCFDEILIAGRDLPDDLPGLGPLGGIVTALRRRQAIFVVACDMPFLDADFIRLMAGKLPGHDAVAVAGEPLHAAYAQSALPAAERQIAAGDYSARRWLEKLRTHYVTEFPERVFFNVNTPADLAQV
jgi:molybdopterin-guanine dinucleotide biosynthesis protein A